MPAQSRKQREIAQRHQLFLDIALDVIQKEGCAALNMDRLAELGEYSRGTVYQHFSCKEEVLVQVCNSSMCYLLSLFERARDIPTSNRDRILAVLVAHNYFDVRQPHCNKIIQYTSDNSIMDKVSESSLQKHHSLEVQLLEVVGSIVADAIEANELTLPENLSAIELVYGLWALNHGSQLLQAAEVSLEEFGITQPEETIARIAALTLDGLNWQPLYNAEQHQRFMQWLKDAVFVNTNNSNSIDDAQKAEGEQND